MAEVAGRIAEDFSAFSSEQMFALAADIERYPEFIPWCRQARVLSRDGDVWRVENHFGAGPIDAVFRTVARPDPPHRLEITGNDAPFRTFRLEWHFAPLPGGGCRVEARYQIALTNPLLQGFARLAMPEATRKIIDRFRARAAALYGGAAHRVL